MRRRRGRILPRGLTHFHHYDRAGNRVRSALACGMGVAKRLLTTTLDTHHRPVILHDDNQTPGVTTDDRFTRWLYDTAGRTVRVTLPNGQVQVNHHDDAGRLVLRALHRQPAVGQAISNATLLASFTWTHDAAGNVKSQTENWHASGQQPARSRTTAMEYDGSNRLVEERIQDSGGTDPVVTSYQYDAANNRTGKTVKAEGGKVLPGQELGHWTYTYNTANQLSRWVRRAAPGTGAVLAAASYTYDKNGNRISKVVDGAAALAVRTTTYTWDSWNRLAEVVVPVTATNKKKWEYSYDHRMRRKSIRQSGGGLKTHHTAVVFNGGLSVAEFRRSSNSALSATTLPWARYLRGPDMGGGVGGLLGTLRHPVNSSEVPVSPTVSKPVTERVNLSNGRGDIVAQSDASGTLTWTASYEAYGKRTLELGSNADRQRANTKEEDPTGLLNEGFRYRDLETGMWLSRDPAGFVDGPNLYAYVQCNPWSRFDPDGLNDAAFFQDEFAAQTPEVQAAMREYDRKVFKGLANTPRALKDSIQNLPHVPGQLIDAAKNPAQTLENIKQAATETLRNPEKFGEFVGTSVVGGGMLSKVSRARVPVVPKPGGTPDVPPPGASPTATANPNVVTSPLPVTSETIAKALEGTGMKTLQPSVSRPVVENYVRRLEAGETPPPISVDGDIIVDGNHRFVAGRVVGTEPPTKPGTAPMSLRPKAEPISNIKVKEEDFGNR